VSRLVVAYEGKETTDRRYIESGALYVKEGEPIIPVRDRNGVLIGLADDFQRDETTGEISMDVELTGKEFNVGRFENATIDVHPMASQIREDGKMVIVNGRIRQISFGMGLLPWSE
jgi:hypothetical protein